VLRFSALVAMRHLERKALTFFACGGVILVVTVVYELGKMNGWWQ
jgi:hypothetical protein